MSNSGDVLKNCPVARNPMIPNVASSPNCGIKTGCERFGESPPKHLTEDKLIFYLLIRFVPMCLLSQKQG